MCQGAIVVCPFLAAFICGWYLQPNLSFPLPIFNRHDRLKGAVVGKNLKGSRHKELHIKWTVYRTLILFHLWVVHFWMEIRTFI
ncbi:hypothetical protein GDO86_013833 [Hymenochirus boettgeri]|uniref:Uncharacterized protein n=1 Tax=Hymenochirus boettgeri TaxID=247094 RepID=A0A8T2JPA2_9PIPI|nr:hypothetical protein GDO86_013833 [Hymenochirus boettgeri]